MNFFLLASLTVASFAVVFALQNTTAVEVLFLGWRFEGSLAVVVMLALILGVLSAFLASLPSAIRHRLSNSAMQKRIRELEWSLEQSRSALVSSPSPELPVETEKSVTAPASGSN